MKKCLQNNGFTLTEMLVALLIISIVLSASLPVITKRTRENALNYNSNISFPIGGIILWGDLDKLPDNTWLEANGQAIPNGIEYEQIKRIYGTNLPDMRGMQNEVYTRFSNYINNDLKNYLSLVTFPKDAIAIWGTTAALPEGWNEATEYRGVFLRGYGTSQTYTNSWTDGLNVARNISMTHTSGNIGVIQGDSIREIYGEFNPFMEGCGGGNWHANGPFYVVSGSHIGNAYQHDTDNCSMVFMTSRVIPTSNEIRPVNKAVKFIKAAGASLADFPKTPPTQTNYRYIVKVKY